MSDTIYECEDCHWKGPVGRMGAIDDADERVSIGELYPAGQCPECGSLIGVADADIPDYTLESVVDVMRERGWVVVKPAEG